MTNTKGPRRSAAGSSQRRTPKGLGDLRPDRRNARRHTDRNLAMIDRSLEVVGPGRSIVIDEKASVLAGNATHRQALKRGLKLKVVDADRDTLIAVRRSDLTADEKLKLALFDNRSGELAEWDVEVLRRLASGGAELEGIWTDDELIELLGAGAGRTNADAIPAVRKTSIVAGDLFHLGQHRLVCGDSTDPDVVARVTGDLKPRVMTTDPPYGVKYDPAWRRRAGVNNSARMGTVENDDRVDWSSAYRLFRGDVAYVWHAGVFAGPVEASLRESDFEIRAQIIWRKARMVLSRGHYHEPCWYAVRKGRQAHWGGKRNQSTDWPIVGGVHRCQSCGAVEADETITVLPSTVWDISSRDVAEDATTHGTQKPVECMARAMRNHSAPVAYDPFVGSGTSIIAAEQLKRTCVAVELNPSYVQQAIDRWEAFTGKRARKVAGKR